MGRVYGPLQFFWLVNKDKSKTPPSPWNFKDTVATILAMNGLNKNHTPEIQYLVTENLVSVSDLNLSLQRSLVYHMQQ